MRVLVLNSGSSSLKYELFDATTLASLAAGIVEEIGTAEARLVARGAAPAARPVGAGEGADHRTALAAVLDALRGAGFLRRPEQLAGVGHRVVHGGEAFEAPTLVDDRVVAAIRATFPLAPLHNPANLMGIEVARRTLPGVPQVAVFDTAFHRTLPPRAFTYAIPRGLARAHGVRRYGFHGTSHRYVAGRAAALLGRPLAELNLVTLHLGNGASAAAIEAGRSVDTSMGMTPLEGLVMGTRSGDLDPAVPLLLARRAGLDADAIDRLLEEESGLLGLCGTSDVREVLARAAAGDPDAGLAVDVYCHRVKRYVGAFLAVLGRVDALVFTAGVGENSPEIRRRTCAGLERLGIALDEGRNEAGPPEREIQAAGAAVKVLVVPTDEEREIARATLDVLDAAGARDPRREEGP